MSNKTEKRGSALQRTRYRELSPSSECAEFANIGRLDRDNIDDGRWAAILTTEKSLQIFSPTACTHSERETGPTGAPLPWDCSPCTTKVCETILEARPMDESLTEGTITEETALLYCSKRGTVTRGIDNMRKARGEMTSNVGSLRMKGIIESIGNHSGNGNATPMVSIKVK